MTQSIVLELVVANLVIIICLKIVKYRMTNHYFLPSNLNNEDRLVIHISK